MKLKPLLVMMLLLGSVLTLKAAPFIGYLYPAGGERGRVVELIIGGQSLNAKGKIYCTNTGVKVNKITTVPNIPPTSGSQKKWLNSWIAEVEAGTRILKEKTEADDPKKEWRDSPWFTKIHELTPLELSLLDYGLHVRANALQATPSLNQRVIVELEIAPDAELGECEIRFYSNAAGISNGKKFFVDDATHVLEPRYHHDPKKQAKTPDIQTIPVVLNGQILPGEIDTFKLQLTADQEYSFALVGTALNPFIGDAVPGHFQPILRLLDSKGREVALADDVYHNPDPVLNYKATQTELYTLQVYDALYRGRADFVYRVVANSAKVAYQPPKLYSEYLPLQIEDDDAIQKEIELTLKPQEVRKFKIYGAANTTIVCETFARRLGSPLDSRLVIRDQKGKIIAENDDMPTTLNLDVCRQNCDSLLEVKLPSTGNYTLELSDRTGAGGQDYSCILQIRYPTPKAFVYANSSALFFKGNNKLSVTFYVNRYDGFSGPVKIGSPDLKAIGNDTIPEGESKATLTFQLTGATMANIVKTIILNYSYMVDGQEIKMRVVPTDEAMQAFAYTHLVVAPKFYVMSSKAIKPMRRPDRRLGR